MINIACRVLQPVQTFMRSSPAVGTLPAVLQGAQSALMTMVYCLEYSYCPYYTCIGGALQLIKYHQVRDSPTPKAKSILVLI